MRNRFLRARSLAKAKVKPAKKVKSEPSEPKAKVEKQKVIVAKDPVSGKVVLRLKDYEDAVANGFDEPNIKKALKNGTKYKGHLWDFSK